MKLINKNIFLLLIMALFTFSCNDFLDVNSDPNKVDAEQVNLSSLLPTALEATSETHYSTIYTASRVTHQVDHVAGYYTEFTMDADWSRIYLESLNTLKVIADKAEEEESPHYLGIARALQALNLGILTDSWEDAPYSMALTGSKNITPEYDSQESLYGMIFIYLDEAEAGLMAEESFNEPGQDDMVYGGDLSKWLKLVHSLRARYMLHLHQKGVFTAAQILAEIDEGFESNADNFQLFYNDVNLNPVHSKVALANETGNLTITHGKYLVDLMNGRLYTVFDPRLPIIADTTGSEKPTYEGLASYDSNSPVHSTEITRSTWYATADAPIIMMNYSELKFIEAEMALSTDIARANEAYLDGISAHMDMLGVSESDENDYLTDPNVDMGGSPDLEHIMKEKYLALFLNFETWNDMRRYGFSTDVYKGFEEPEYDGRDEPATRALYPISELNRNGANLFAHIKDFTDTMWKDQN
ncbi:SusD/RagB family nutrient-binding outer membrane lipoprotein [Fulvivirga ligni]|uniref:SusD/RagB family nutrient-binding outer membrane lipoprotein n=1 Tax=Fulvivirga ligni TaxID=2904246 RepID=UPI001F1A25A5|nr:SusD/RagB family nutrient-binding outer membrane lipoprotein [Fulvivirga ligni]UII23588.1 SusD/RagB family nutrient-binding outer membrane lipoprotein [Fulvivirga ligni]